MHGSSDPWESPLSQENSAPASSTWLCVFSRESGEREKVAALKHLVPEVKQNLGEVKTSLVQHRETRGMSKHCRANPPFFSCWENEADWQFLASKPTDVRL